MFPALPPLKHSLVLNVQGLDSIPGWSLEFSVFRSRNGFVRRAELTAILESRDSSNGALRRKVVKASLPFPEKLQTPQSLLGDWECDGIRFTGSRFSGKVRAAEGDFEWDLELGRGHPLDFSPIPRRIGYQTLRTQIPLQGSWRLADLAWSSTGSQPVTASLHFRDEPARIPEVVAFHSQFLHDSSRTPLHCADGMHAKGWFRGLNQAPPLTSIQAFDRLKGNPRFSLWRALRSRMFRSGRGWSFRTEQDGIELRGKIEVESRHWITLRCEDCEGAPFFRTSTRFASLEILALSNGKPQGLYRSHSNTWLEWTTREVPLDSSDLR